MVPMVLVSQRPDSTADANVKQDSQETSVTKQHVRVIHARTVVSVKLDLMAMFACALGLGSGRTVKLVNVL